jgi:hypothetical protein
MFKTRLEKPGYKYYETGKGIMEQITDSNRRYYTSMGRKEFDAIIKKAKF